MTCGPEETFCFCFHDHAFHFLLVFGFNVLNLFDLRSLQTVFIMICVYFGIELNIHSIRI